MQSVNSPSDFLITELKNAESEPLNRLHRHPWHELYVIALGSCDFLIGEKTVTAKAGDVIFIPKGTAHYLLYCSADCTRTLMHFTPPYVNMAITVRIPQFFSLYAVTPTPATLSVVESLLSKISAEHKLSDAFSFDMLQSYVTQLLTALMRSPDSISAPEKLVDCRATVSSAVQYILKNFNEDITLDSISKRVMVSKSHFSRQFKSVVGIGFKEYLNSVRMEEAKRLLITSTMNVCEIAFACGFNDSNYFSARFHEVNGTTPLEYRKRERSERANL